MNQKEQCGDPGVREPWRDLCPVSLRAAGTAKTADASPSSASARMALLILDHTKSQAVRVKYCQSNNFVFLKNKIPNPTVFKKIKNKNIICEWLSKKKRMNVGRKQSRPSGRTKGCNSETTLLH
jgi:hypothetical protein